MKKMYLALIMVIGLQAWSSGASAIPILSLQPEYQKISGTNYVDLSLVIDGLDQKSLGAFDILITFNQNWSPLGLFIGDLFFGDQLDLGFGSIFSCSGPSLPGCAPAAAGVINLFEISLAPAPFLDEIQRNNFTLATMRFDVTKGGVGTFGVNIASAFLSDAVGFSIDAQTRNALVEVDEPPTAVLIIIGLMFMTLIGAAPRRD